MTHSAAQARDDNPVSWGWRLGWLVLIWAASVLTLGAAAYAFRLVMRCVGLTR
jgi:Protein of unknown function (DUF2474)